MQFVATDDLKEGMRLAKPIYNKNGVLLYDRDSKLTLPAINSIHNFGLIGIYILEPAEPLPPMSREDLEFEQLQTIYIFRLRDILNDILKRKKLTDLNPLIEDILKHYGSLDHRVNFNQNLRSPEDFIYKHAISTAILVSMMTSNLGLAHQRQQACVAAALLYGIGFCSVPKPIMQKGDNLDDSDMEIVARCLVQGVDLLSNYRGDFPYMPQAIALSQVFIHETYGLVSNLTPDIDLKKLVAIFRTADAFDRDTAMSVGHEPVSEIKAMQNLQKDTILHPEEIVQSLTESIHICPVAASVDFTDGTKGIVLVENPTDFLKPVVLHISNNRIYDLSLPGDSAKFQIKDIMKTMDNRILIDTDTLRHFIPDQRLKKLTQQIKKGRR